MKRKLTDTLQELWRLPFVRGLLCGGIAAAMLFVSWRAVLIVLGAAALWLLLGKR